MLKKNLLLNFAIEFAKSAQEIIKCDLSNYNFGLSSVSALDTLYHNLGTNYLQIGNQRFHLKHYNDICHR